jgi:hypothetical protein
MPTTHIAQPERAATEFPGIAVNEYFCMRLAAACGLPTARRVDHGRRAHVPGGRSFDPAAITHVIFDDLADDLGLTKTIFARDRRQFVARAHAAAADLAAEARREGWHDPVIDAIAAVMGERADRTA